MLRPGKELQEPLLPRDANPSDGAEADDKHSAKKKYRLTILLQRAAVAALNGRLFYQYVSDRDAVYFVPGEWLVLVLLVITLFQTNPNVSRSNTSKAIHQGYLLFLGLSLFLPLTWTYVWMACAIPVQGSLLGVELASLLKEDEEVNAKIVDDDAVFGSPLDSSKTHFGIQCSECGALHFVGTRYKSKHIPHYDLCGACWETLAASDAEMYSSFEVMRQPEPVSPEMLVELREEENRIRKQKRQQKENMKKEITLLAGKNLNIV